MFKQQGRCSREKPPCKYFHPPQHLKDQLLINGRNHLALKQALMQTQLTHMPVLGTQLPVVSILFLFLSLSLTIESQVCVLHKIFSLNHILLYMMQEFELRFDPFLLYFT